MDFNTYIRTISSGRGFQPLLSADQGGGGGEGGTDNPSDNNTGGEGGQSGAGDQSNSLDLDTLMKDPVFKAQYEERLKQQMSKRLKKYEGIDPEEYKALKAKEEQQAQANMTEAEKLQKELEAYKQREQQLEETQKEIAVKEFAFANGHDPKLLSRLIDTSGLTKGEDGKYQGLSEAFEQVRAEFPQLFPSEDESNSQADETHKSGGGAYKLPKQNGNPEKKKDKYSSGKARAQARHGQQN
ncbi:scaffolding protein [Bacillus phage 031MP002]|nr:scaffolding protein [Bacillus phage 031MP003]QFG05505.1 scaffolding protein [Bacillus phage 031MP002]